MTKAEMEAIRRIIREEIQQTVPATVREIMSAHGIDTTNPTETQKDVAWLRRNRMAAEAIKQKVWGVAIGTLALSALTLLWLGFKSKLGLD